MGSHCLHLPTYIKDRKILNSSRVAYESVIESHPLTPVLNLTVFL